MCCSCRSNGEKNPRVKHYQIRQSEEEGKFYLAEKYLFSTIPELIHYHQHNAAGESVRLILRRDVSGKESGPDLRQTCSRTHCKIPVTLGSDVHCEYCLSGCVQPNLTVPRTDDLAEAFSTHRAG